MWNAAEGKGSSLRLAILYIDIRYIDNRLSNAPPRKSSPAIDTIFVKMRYAMLVLLFCGAMSAQTHRLTLEDLLSVDAIGEAALSPDGKTFAMTRGGQIVLTPASGGWPVTLTSTAGGKSGLSWSPDGRMIAFASQGGIWVVPAAGGAPRRLTNSAAGPGDPRQASDRQPQYSPKGRWILFETGRRGHNNLMVVSEDGMVSTYLTEANNDEESASWSPDGTRISYTARAPEYFSGKLNVVKFDQKSGEAAGDPATLIRRRPIAAADGKSGGRNGHPMDRRSRWCCRIAGGITFI